MAIKNNILDMEKKQRNPLLNYKMIAYI